MLLCSPVSVSLCLHLLALSDLLFSLQVHLSLLLLSQLCISVLCFCCALCSACHVPSMHHSSSVHFSCCTLPPSTHLNHSQQQPHLFFVLHSYSLCAPCASYMCNPSTCSTPRHCSPHRDIHSHFVASLPQAQHTLSVLHVLLCRVLCLIIIATLQLLWRLNPCVHHHWVLCLRFLSLSSSRDSSSSLS
jgi:hypothetical protein